MLYQKHSNHGDNNTTSTYRLFLNVYFHILIFTVLIQYCQYYMGVRLIPVIFFPGKRKYNVLVWKINIETNFKSPNKWTTMSTGAALRNGYQFSLTWVCREFWISSKACVFFLSKKLLSSLLNTVFFPGTDLSRIYISKIAVLWLN